MKLGENGSGFYNSDKCKNWSMEDEKKPGVSLISKADREDEGGSSAALTAHLVGKGTELNK